VIHHKGNFALPTNPQQNTAGAPLIEIMNAVGNIGFDVTIEKISSREAGWDPVQPVQRVQL
jgi:hypothetical protein